MISIIQTVSDCSELYTKNTNYPVISMGYLIDG